MFFLMLITIVYAIVQAVTAVEVKFYFYYMYMIGKSETDRELFYGSYRVSHYNKRS